jgi:hypothetical protein
VIDLRLSILSCLCKWDLGDNLESVLRFASDEQAEDANLVENISGLWRRTTS